VAVDDVGEASFEGAAGFILGFLLSEFALEVEMAGTGIASLAHGDGVQCRVQCPDMLVSETRRTDQCAGFASGSAPSLGARSQDRQTTTTVDHREGLDGRDVLT